jgi:drug/metabolite transporter (DMT)-like permease
MHYVGELCALGTAVCWSIGSNLFAGAAGKMAPMVLNRLRITAACLLLMAALLVTRGAPWPVWATRMQVGLLALSGLIGFVFGDGWYFRSLVILGPGRASLLSSSAPVFTALLAWPLLHEHPGPLAALGMAMVVGGVAWVVAARSDLEHEHAHGSVALGVFAGVMSAIGQAGGYVLSKTAMRQGLDPLSATVIRVTAATVGIWLLAAAMRDVPRTIAALKDRRATAFLTGGALFGPFLGVTFSLAALKHIDAGVASSITAIYPVFTMLIAARAHHERLTWRALSGASVAVGGVIVLFLR